MKLTDIIRALTDRIKLAKDVTALTGGNRGIDSIVVTSGGASYTSAPGVTISGGTGAAATATLLGDSVGSIAVTAKGTGYPATPTVGFTGGGGGAGATAYAITTALSLDAIESVGLEIGLVVFVVIGSKVSFYQLTAGTDAEVSPTVIRPDDYNGSTNQRVWKLIGVALLDASVTGALDVTGVVTALRFVAGSEALGPYTTNATLTLDCSTAELKTAIANPTSGAITLTINGSNFAIGKVTTLVLENTGSQVTNLSYQSGWRAMESALPSSLAAGKVLYLQLLPRGATAASVLAFWTVEA